MSDTLKIHYNNLHRIRFGKSDNISITALVRYLERGGNICPSVLADESDDFEEQRLFLLDFDNELPEPIITEENIIKICEYFFIPYLLRYKRTPGISGQERFTFAFLFNTPITDSSIRDKIMQKMLTIFPQSNPSCINCRLIFSGAGKNERVVMGDTGTIFIDYFLSNLIKLKKRLYIGEEF